MENLSCEVVRPTADGAPAAAHEKGDGKGEQYTENNEEDHDLLIHIFLLLTVGAQAA